MNSSPRRREKIEPKKEESKRLKEERINKGWTQKEAAADHLRMAESTYRNWETGKVRIPETRIGEVAACFGVRAEYLRGNDDFRTEEDYRRFAVSYYYEQQEKTAADAFKRWRGNMIDAIIGARGVSTHYPQGERELPAEYLINGKWYSVDLERANFLYEHVSAYLAFLITQEGEATGENGDD